MTPQPGSEIRTRRIKTTPDNVAEMREVVRNWPELHDLVQALQKQGVFPGLRGLEITLTGTEGQLAKGLACLTAKTPAKPV